MVPVVDKAAFKEIWTFLLWKKFEKLKKKKNLFFDEIIVWAMSVLLGQLCDQWGQEVVKDQTGSCLPFPAAPLETP